ncbi:tRNA lysidine(34) synthetase TilS [Bacillota bacterium LX-D]|nr:tRNA lysidine(34) synthetase TilS [Bacillota bacterium LX-D]
MLNKIRAFISEHHLLEQNDKIVVGVSGGPDSVVLLHSLAALKDEYNLTLYAAHFNHLIRGQDAEKDALFVEQFARTLGISCTVGYGDVPKYTKEQGLTLEEGARKLRYAFFYNLVNKFRADKIAVGHHGDDQAETVLLHLLRGSGTRGLAGMSPKRNMLIRPLLCLFRSDIELYCQQYNLESRTDFTNFTTEHTRNKIRLELLPTLKTYNPNIAQGLNNLANILRVEDDYLEKVSVNAFRSLAEVFETKIVLDYSKYLSLHQGLRRRILRYAYQLLAGREESLNYRYVQRIELFLEETRTNKKMSLPRGVVLKLTDTAIIISKVIKPRTLAFASSLFVPGRTQLGDKWIIIAKELKWETLGNQHLTASLNEAYLDLDAVQLPLTVRTRKSGDVFKPLGLKGTKKLKNFFADLKVEPERRGLIPIVTDAAGQILWVGGYRIDERYKIRPTTRKVLYLKLHEITKINGRI